MSNNNFELELLDLHWINNTDDPTDLCAHGYVFVKIGNEVVANKDDLEVAVSTTALYLLRTLKNNYKKDDFASQLLPCCGHFFVADTDNERVSIIGCPNGIDWTIIHTDDVKVKHITDNGEEAIIDRERYKELVLNFADKVEDFYKSSLPKIIPADDLEKKGYLAFWREWQKLREEWR
ncbi:hypothetical protein [Riemerella anatipestifer]|uniref:Uncharacterized protein n=3 Tax=Riemerella anatipestifer TaxID=34085 RepID=J9QZH1_RIEAN|nr:hypothetical protein [Riemerella anatipestifer]AFD55718.1 hypothetical protein RA0C_0765 [Riemerella anatipestifer ATCC 11845 = DSM 15868]AFR36050.1 hypothetical protein B739_1452 [Riemerella anatipestifer RA-CH-1]AGC40384.1 hypothetical protein G148_1080 [Riemerella anatipestifer RA-CH-2]AIH03044.1 hypothetical protein M949_1877 [Riemerella anatipestifer CH3]AKP68959.1 hypothetical protein CG08_0595 [Riemerella anatipestifer]